MIRELGMEEMNMVGGADEAGANTAIGNAIGGALHSLGSNDATTGMLLAGPGGGSLGLVAGAIYHYISKHT